MASIKYEAKKQLLSSCIKVLAILIPHNNKLKNISEFSKQKLIINVDEP
jgi:hypothetical protein